MEDYLRLNHSNPSAILILELSSSILHPRLSSILDPQFSILHLPSSILDPPFGGRFWESNSDTRTPGILRITNNGERIIATRRLIVVRRRPKAAKPL